MNRHKYLLFDLDGTLLDNREAIVEAVMYAACKYAPGCYLEEELRGRFGETFDDFLNDLEQRAAAPVDRVRVYEDYVQFLREHHDQQVKLFPYVEEGLYSLKSQGFRMAVVTNKQREFALKGLELAGLLHLFEAVVTLDDVAEGKPSPEPLRKALYLLQAEPQASLMVGDSIYDWQAAKAAGVESVLLDWYGDARQKVPDADDCFPNFRKFVDRLLTPIMNERA
ncbi:HAD family hydrolase [Brevibacillus fulvus]|uniref:Pyrophosphatase PpaX n=1 Tax=Brevibacillus fulvus TaxID=1125967 RepID=A0A938Y1G9_9BACL|nr:HAD-IA family hydrolase [Brevibacillus fulvus]MBM7590271.1 pyrophosphatase PpaX [Brevibacillus fulvus]